MEFRKNTPKVKKPRENDVMFLKLKYPIGERIQSNVAELFKRQGFPDVRIWDVE